MIILFKIECAQDRKPRMNRCFCLIPTIKFSLIYWPLKILVHYFFFLFFFFWPKSTLLAWFSMRIESACMTCSCLCDQSEQHWQQMLWIQFPIHLSFLFTTLDSCICLNDFQDENHCISFESEILAFYNKRMHTACSCRTGFGPRN